MMLLDLAILLACICKVTYSTTKRSPEEVNVEKLEAFQAAVNSNGNSHLVTVPPGTILSDMLFATPIFMEEGAADEQGGGPAVPRSNVVDGFDYGELGVDPTLDPELALALRVSMEEERARQEASASGTQAPGPAETPAPMAAAPPDEGGVEDMDEDALLQEALALSMAVDQTPAATPAPEQTPAPAATPAGPVKEARPPVVDEDMDEEMDPELALALQVCVD